MRRCHSDALDVTAGGMLTGPKAESGDLFYFNNRPESWLAVYRASGLLEVDPIVRWAMASGTPSRWDDLASRLDAADPAREPCGLAARHGYRECFALPVRTLAGHLGLDSVSWWNLWCDLRWVCPGGRRSRLERQPTADIGLRWSSDRLATVEWRASPAPSAIMKS